MCDNDPIVLSPYAVYLFHIGMLHHLVFYKWFKDQHLFTHWYFPVVLIVNAFLIYLIAVVIDKLRKYCLERPLMPAIDGLAGFLARKIAYPGQRRN